MTESKSVIKNQTKDKIDKIVLVGVLRDRRDLNILLREKWYRIPVRYAPRRRFDYLAFYQPAPFGHQGKRIRYYARVLSSRTQPFQQKGWANSDSPQPSVERLDQIGIKDKRRPSPFDKRGCPKGDSARAKRVPIWNYQIIKRGNLLPEEPDHPRARDYYLRVRIGKIKKLPQPIRNIIPRRISFGFTTLNHLLKSKDILQLYNVTPTEQIVDDGLKEARIRAIPQYHVKGEQKRYFLDFAIFCQKGMIAIECDNKKVHSIPSQKKKDRIKNIFLRNQGWNIIRLPEDNIVSDLPGCIKRIKKAVQKLGGVK